MGTSLTYLERGNTVTGILGNVIFILRNTIVRVAGDVSLHSLLKGTFEAEIGTFQHIVIFDSEMISSPPWVTLLIFFLLGSCRVGYWQMNEQHCCLRCSRCLLFSASQQFKSTRLFESSVLFLKLLLVRLVWSLFKDINGGRSAACLFILFMWCLARTEERYTHAYITC